jgi:hypothetical protein
MKYKSKYIQCAINDENFLDLLKNLINVKIPPKQKKKFFSLAEKQSYQEKIKKIIQIIDNNLKSD